MNTYQKNVPGLKEILRGLFIRIIFVLCFFVGSNNDIHALPEQPAADVEKLIRQSKINSRIVVDGETICAVSMLQTFYERRKYACAWSSQNQIMPQADSLLKAIKTSDREGLIPNDYHLAKITALLSQMRENQSQNQINGQLPDPDKLAALDLLLTDAFLLYGFHLSDGRINSETIHAEWYSSCCQPDMAAILQTALDSNQIEQSLKDFLPRQSGYHYLRGALAHYRRIARDGGWPVVPEGPKIRAGSVDGRAGILRKRLFISGDINLLKEDNIDFVDMELNMAVRRFQRRHGLIADGVVGPDTLSTLNVPVEDRIRQIKLNMERWRWLPKELGQEYILVNIANFSLDAVESEKTVMTMKVVVGRPFRDTPVLSSKMAQIIINPYWYVPRKIAVEDMLPKIQKDSGYLDSKKMRVFAGEDMKSPEIDAKTIDWSTITPDTFTYRLQQEPGTMNALGRIKFIFPNKFSVYLHDTQARELFSRIDRGFSSGCIRIEKAIDLAEYLLRHNPKWNRSNIENAIEVSETKTIKIIDPVLIHLVYRTSWADENGTIQFRKDIYGRDIKLQEAFNERPLSLAD